MPSMCIFEEIWGKPCKPVGPTEKPVPWANGPGFCFLVLAAGHIDILFFTYDVTGRWPRFANKSHVSATFLAQTVIFGAVFCDFDVFLIFLSTFHQKVVRDSPESIGSSPMSSGMAYLYRVRKG